MLARRGALAGLAGLLGGCSPASLLNVTVPREGYTLTADIAYGTHPRQTLDIYRPTTPADGNPAVLFFYGGSWTAGRKDDYLFVGQALAARGVTTIVADYRLYPEVTYPAFVEDGAMAAKWSADNAGTTRLFLMGHSAGAYIALMLAANTPYLAAAGVDRTKLAGVIGLSGPYDFLPLTSKRLQEIFGGANRRETQPIAYVGGPLPPVLLVHGTDDTIVRPANSERLAAAWRQAGGMAELRLYPDIGHIDVVAAFADFLHKRAPSRDDALAFIARR